MRFLDLITAVAKHLLGTTNEATLHKLWPTVREVTALEGEMQRADDTALRERGKKLRAQVQAGASLESVMVEAFALAREVADRRLGIT